MRMEIQVSGMRCSGCEILVSEALEELDGVSKAKASYLNGVIEVEYDSSMVDSEALKKVIGEQGFTVTT
ncbi:MAG: heavy-metal-associated domain-containing protein [Chlorobiaceae bacterium]|nr:heavy-metal-associated domain-containing protein [Chlorobiaceae bacterium]